jgi:hypothetical protein
VVRPHHDSVRIHIEAAPRAVWHLVADVSRMGEWSPVCRHCEWVAPATGPAPGARFVGRNRIAGLRWSRECEVLASEPGAEFAFQTLVGGRPSTEWRYSFIAGDTGGTEVIEQYTVTSTSASPRWVQMLDAIPGLYGRSRAAMHDGMAETLRRIKAAAEAT